MTTWAKTPSFRVLCGVSDSSDSVDNGRGGSGGRRSSSSSSSSSSDGGGCCRSSRRRRSASTTSTQSAEGEDRVERSLDWRAVLPVGPAKDGSRRSEHYSWGPKGILLHEYEFGRWGAIEEFSLVQVLGSGRSCRVLSVRDRRTRQLYAIKAYDKAAVGRDLGGHIRREVTLLLGFQHESVCQLYGAFEDACHVYLVMELCERGDLIGQLWRKDKPVTVSERYAAAQVLEPLLRAVGCLHGRGIVHRDIKPENVFLDGEGRVKLGDFGLSINQSRDTPRSVVGTHDYMAPEVYSLKLLYDSGASPGGGKAGECAALSYDEKVDIWACGVLAYELCMGAAPFSVKKYGEDGTARHVVASPVPLHGLWPRYASQEFKNFIAWTLQKDPKSRPSAPQLLTHAWVQVHLPPERQLPSSDWATFKPPPPRTPIKSKPISNTSQVSSPGCGTWAMSPGQLATTPQQAGVRQNLRPPASGSSVHPKPKVKIEVPGLYGQAGRQRPPLAQSLQQQEEAARSAAMWGQLVSHQGQLAATNRSPSFQDENQRPATLASSLPLSSLPRQLSRYESPVKGLVEALKEAAQEGHVADAGTRAGVGLSPHSPPPARVAPGGSGRTTPPPERGRAAMASWQNGPTKLPRQRPAEVVVDVRPEVPEKEPPPPRARWQLGGQLLQYFTRPAAQKKKAAEPVPPAQQQQLAQPKGSPKGSPKSPNRPPLRSLAIPFSP